ncbi:MAG: hypothetical protein SOW15_04255 [Ruminococcus callidus]|nr:hypothetical protein [Ruminococcus callidus]
MKNHNQVKVFVSVFLALLSVQEIAAAPCMAAPVVAESQASQNDAVEALTPSVVSVPEELPVEVAPSDFLSIASNHTIPNITKGTAVSISGIVKSDFSKITVLTVGVYNASGEQMTGKTVSPNQVEYDLHALDNEMQFESLPTGTYYYRVTASNATYQDYTVLSQSFTVSDSAPQLGTSADDISITGGVTVPDITAGQFVRLTGVVTSATTQITKLTVGVFDQEGNQLTGKTVRPYSQSYDIRNLDSYVQFGTLSAGTYYYKVIATNTSNTNYIVVNQNFTVSESLQTATEDSISIVNGTTIPTNIPVGKAVSIGGTVQSDSNMTKITAGVYDQNNNLVTGRSAYPNAKSYNIENLDYYVNFGNLTVGTYYYKVLVSNGTHTNYTVVSQKFTVTSNGSSTVSDTISVLGGTTIPNITVGKPVSIGGIVTSQSSNMTRLTIGVFNESGTPLTGRTVVPNSKTYNIANLDAYVSFGDLSAGTYYYKVIATNGTHTNYTVVNQKFTVSDSSSVTSDTIRITGGTTIPNIKVGNVVSIGGTVQSGSNITKITVGVYDQNNNLVTGQSAYPNTTSYNVANLDYYVSFGDLTAGTYYYKVLVTNGTNTNYAVVNQKFTVSDSSSTTSDTMSITGGTTIPNIKVGNVVSIGGVVQSKSSNITKLTVGVYSASGNLITGKTVAPNATSYNVANLDYYVSFGDLTAGTYYYKVIATNASYSNDTLVNQKFTVSDSSSAVSDTLSITGGTSVPNITEGSAVVVKGTVKSTSSNITKLTVGVYSASGNLITGKTVTPNAKSYDLRNLDVYVNFNLLTPGSYTYRVIVSNGTQSNTVVTNQAFQVTEKSNSQNQADTMSLSGGKTIPNIKVGKAVSIRGTVKSASSNITSLTVGVFSSSGNLITGKTVAPYAKSYDISQLDAYVNFNLLSADTYYYGVVATNGSYQNKIVSYQKFTVSK